MLTTTEIAEDINGILTRSIALKEMLVICEKTKKGTPIANTFKYSEQREIVLASSTKIFERALGKSSRHSPYIKEKVKAKVKVKPKVFFKFLSSYAP